VSNENKQEILDVILRSYSSDDLPQIIDILKVSFPDWQIKKDPINYWKWKYLKPPSGSQISIISLDEKVLGVAHLILLKIKLGSKIVIGQYSVDDAIHPKYRGKGLYNKFKSTWYTTPAKVSYWITSNPINIERARKLGIMQLPFMSTKMIRINKIKLFFEENKMDSIKARLGLTFLKKLNEVTNKFTQRITVSDSLIENVEEFDERIEEFLEKINENYQLMIFKDREYLNWRFCDKDAGDIIVRQVLDENKISGYHALEIKEKKEQLEGYVLDLLALPDRMDVAELLFREACAISDEMNVNVLHYRVIKGHPYERLARKHGFLDVTKWSDSRIYIDEYESERARSRSIGAYSPSQIHFSIGDFL
jgi:hypothetical protein